MLDKFLLPHKEITKSGILNPGGIPGLDFLILCDRTHKIAIVQQPKCNRKIKIKSLLLVYKKD